MATRKAEKQPGDPFEKDDPVWIMNLNDRGVNYAGNYDRVGTTGWVYIRVAPERKAGWWIDLTHTDLRHRRRDDGITGKIANADSPESEEYDPLK